LLVVKRRPPHTGADRVRQRPLHGGELQQASVERVLRNVDEGWRREAVEGGCRGRSRRECNKTEVGGGRERGWVGWGGWLKEITH
jgi:hypothetical protein